MGDGKINYEEFLKKHFWSLEEAVSLVTGEPSNINNQFTRNLLTHKQALAAIEDGILESEVKEIMYKHIESKEYEPTPTHCVKPRDFMDWCNNNDIEVVSEIADYFNSKYWIQTMFWKFDELAMSLSLEEPPFPREIRNVFEDDFCHKYAKKLKQFLLEKKCSNLFFQKSDFGMTRILSTNNIRGSDIYLKQTAALTLIGENQELLEGVKNKTIKQEILKNLTLFNFADSVSKTPLPMRSDKYKEELEKLMKSTAIFGIPDSYSPELNAELKKIKSFEDTQFFARRKFSRKYSYIEETTEQVFAKKNPEYFGLDFGGHYNCSNVVDSLYKNLGAIELADYAYDERLGKMIRQSGQELENDDLVFGEQEESIKTAGREISVKYDKVFEALLEMFGAKDTFVKKLENQKKDDYIQSQSILVANAITKLRKDGKNTIKILFKSKGKKIDGPKVKSRLLSKHDIKLTSKSGKGDISKSELGGIFKKINDYLK